MVNIIRDWRCLTIVRLVSVTAIATGGWLGSEAVVPDLDGAIEWSQGGEPGHGSRGGIARDRYGETTPYRAPVGELPDAGS